MSNYTLVLVDRDGKKQTLPDPYGMKTPAWIIHAGKWWGFGVRKTNGETFYFEALNNFWPACLLARSQTKTKEQNENGHNDENRGNRVDRRS